VLELILSCFFTALLTASILIFYLRRTVPDIQGILDDVGTDVGEQIKEVFGNPAVKNWMGSMGKKSGEVRATSALRNKAADKLLEGYPSIGFILDQLDLTPVEGLQLIKDPLIGPFIQGALQKGLKGLQNPGSNPSSSSGKVGY